MNKIERYEDSYKIEYPEQKIELEGLNPEKIYILEKKEIQAEDNLITRKLVIGDYRSPLICDAYPESLKLYKDYIPLVKGDGIALITFPSYSSRISVLRVLRPDDEKIGLKSVYFKGFYPREFRPTKSDKHHILKLQPDDECCRTNGNDYYLTNDLFDVQSTGFYDLEEVDENLFRFKIVAVGNYTYVFVGYMTIEEKVVGDITLESISNRIYNGENKTFTPKLGPGELSINSLTMIGDRLTEKLWKSEHKEPDYSRLDEEARKKYKEMKETARKKLLESLKRRNKSADYSSETNTFITKSIYCNREFTCTLDADAKIMDAQLCERHEFDIPTGKGILLDSIFGPLANPKSIETKTINHGKNNIKFISRFTCENSSDVAFLLNGTMNDEGILTDKFSIDISGDKRTVNDKSEVERIASVYSDVIDGCINFGVLKDNGKLKNEGPMKEKKEGQ